MAGQRQGPPVLLQFEEGLYSNETDRGAKARWVRGDNVRWNDGLPEKIGGYVVADLVDVNGDPTTYMGKVRSTHEWDSLDGETWIAFGTACKLYLINRLVLYDITPVRYQSAVAGGFTTTTGSSIVTVVDPAHGAQDGDHLTLSSDVTVGGLTLSGEYEITQVIDADTYTITDDELATSNATSVGSVFVSYDISCGLESDGPLYGYGVGLYGMEAYGTARSTSTYMGTARHWSLDNWGEDLLASPSGGTLYEWKRAWGPQSRAKAVIGAPANIERMLVGPDDRHVIALGTNLVSTGQQDKMFTRWCKGDDYTVWIASATNDAGSKRLDLGSKLISATKSRNGIVVYSDKALYFTSLVGGTDVYSIAPAGRTAEIISPEAAVDVDGTVYFLARDKNFYRWDGTLKQLECDIGTLVFGTANTAGVNQQMANKTHARVLKEYSEIWWSFPLGDTDENNATAIYNYKTDKWYFSSIPREAGADASPAYDRLPYAFYNQRFWFHETGTDGDDGDGFVEPLDNFIESYQREVLEGAVEVRLTKLIPDFDVLDGPIDVTVLGKERPQSDVTKSYGPKLFFSDTEFICPDLRVRQIAIRVGSNDLGSAWRMGAWTGYGTPVTRKSR